MPSDSEELALSRPIIGIAAPTHDEMGPMGHGCDRYARDYALAVIDGGAFQSYSHLKIVLPK